MRSDIRRLSFVQITQQFGFSIEQIRTLLDTLPEGRTPNKVDWRQISRSIRQHLDSRIETLERLRDNLDGCIGCGCLSLRKCALYNPASRVPRSEYRLKTDALPLRDVTRCDPAGGPCWRFPSLSSDSSTMNKAALVLESADAPDPQSRTN